MKIGLTNNKDFEEIDSLLKNHFKKNDSYKLFTNPSECKDLDLIIVNDPKDYKRTNCFIRNLKDSGIVIINYDETGDNNKIFFGNAKVISYGFNSQANITASSVEENNFTTVQCCLQKALNTVTGKTIEEQEFSVNAKNKEINNILASVATLLVDDVEISDIDSFF